MIDSETVTVDLLKATLPREQFADRVSVVSRALSTRASVLVLGGIELRTSNGRLELAATDMELSLRASVEADVAGEGTVVVPGRLLLDIARALPEPDVTIEHLPEESVLVITSGGATYRIHTYAAEDFPNLPSLDAVPLQQVDADVLLQTDRPGWPLRVARREPARAHGDLRELRARQARDGRDRLLPARRQGDRVPRPAARARGDHPGASAPGARRGSAAARRRSSSPCRRTTSCSGPTACG